MKENYFEQIYKNAENGGTILRHSLVDINAIDYNDVYEIALDKANNGSVVEILPDTVINDPLYAILFEGAKENKCPDIKVDGIFWEIKTPTLPLKERKISKAIRNSHEQANCMIIRLNAKYNNNYLKKVAKGRFETHNNIERIEFKCCITAAYYCFDRDSI